MLNFGGVAIPMLTNSNLEFVLGCDKTIELMTQQAALPIFSNEVCNFLQKISTILMKNVEAKNLPDVVTFGFWCRKASVLQMKKAYEGEELRFGKGIAFHIAPSNVAVNFAYSIAAALLAGNMCIGRLPSKKFPQTAILCNALEQALEETPEMRSYLVLIRYGHEKEVTDYLSRICDIRIIWGGGGTIEKIRTSPMKSRAFEITFADRYSMAVIDGDAYLEAEDKARIANDFYNDTYLTDQNACTSPRIVVWIGERTKEARKIFWDSIYDIVTHKQYNLQPVQAVDKYTKLCLLGAHEKASWRKGKDNLIMRAEVERLNEDIAEFFGNSGFFLEYAAKDIDEIMPLCKSRCQTLSYYGVSKEVLKDMVEKNRPSGIDRIVPIGRTMDFSLVWDGHDLVREMSRVVTAV